MTHCWSVLGLVLDIVGVVMLLWGDVSAYAATLRQSRDQPLGETVWQRGVITAAKWLASTDPLARETSVVEAVATRARGFVLVIFGFFFQVLGNYVQ